MQIVPLNEFADGGAYLVEVLEDSPVDRLLFERSIEALGHTVGLGLLDESDASASNGGRRLDFDSKTGANALVLLAERGSVSHRSRCRLRDEQSSS